jgi:hypothetical protein
MNDWCNASGGQRGHIYWFRRDVQSDSVFPRRKWNMCLISDELDFLESRKTVALDGCVDNQSTMLPGYILEDGTLRAYR